MLQGKTAMDFTGNISKYKKTEFSSNSYDLISYDIQSKTHQYFPLEYSVLESYQKICGLSY